MFVTVRENYVRVELSVFSFHRDLLFHGDQLLSHLLTTLTDHTIKLSGLISDKCMLIVKYLSQ